MNESDQYKDEAKAEFATGADGWLIAYASVSRLVLVTHEEESADAKKRVPIPNICRVFNVECVNTFEMLKALNVKLG